MSERSRRAPPIVPALCALVLVLQASLLIRTPERILDRPLTEDGYYALTVARNIAEGNGPTVDGERPTNGFQPLFTLLTVPLFWTPSGDPILPLRLLLGLHLVVLAATAAVVGSIARQAFRAAAAHASRGELVNQELLGSDAGWVAAFLYLAGVGTFLQHTNGLETGFYLFLIAVAWRVYQRRPGVAAVDAIVVGVVLGLVVLTRIDAVFLVIVVAIGEAWRGRRNPQPALARAITVAGVAALISLPWWLYNVMGFGTPMPTSGLAQQEFLLSFERTERAISAWLADAVPWVYARRGGSWLADVVRVALLVPVVMAVRSLRGDRRVEPGRIADDTDGVAGALLEKTRRFGGYLVTFSLLLAAWYGVSSWASHFYVRYLAPLIPVATVAATFSVMRFLSRQRSIAFTAAVVLLGGMLFVVVALHQGRVFGRNDFHADQLTLIERHVPRDAWVAAGQTGTLGYFRDRVLNLDGKVNPEAFASRADIPDYLERRDVRWFCDWPWFVEHYFGKHPEARGWRLVDQRGAFRLYRRGTP